MDNNELYHHGVKGMKWGVRRANRLAKNHSDYNKAHAKKKVSEMSDAELRARNNRLQMEQQYADLRRKSSTGQKAVKAFIGTAGTIAAVTAAVATYKKAGKDVVALGAKVVDKIGDYVVGSIHF